MTAEGGGDNTPFVTPFVSNTPFVTPFVTTEGESNTPGLTTDTRVLVPGERTGEGITPVVTAEGGGNSPAVTSDREGTGEGSTPFVTTEGDSDTPSMTAAAKLVKRMGVVLRVEHASTSASRGGGRFLMSEVPLGAGRRTWPSRCWRHRARLGGCHRRCTPNQKPLNVLYDVPYFIRTALDICCTHLLQEAGGVLKKSFKTL